MRQLITPNPHIPCTPGWCLQYVRQTFGLPGIHPTATAAWEASTTKHQDRDFPPGVWLAVWYGLVNEPAGHVVLMAPDGSVYSTSSLDNTPYHHPDLADLEAFYARYGMTLTYRGWTEDVQGIPVIAPSITTHSSTQEEGFLMALSDQDQAEIRDNLRKLVKAADEEKVFDAGVNEKVDELVGNARKTFWNTEEARALLTNTPALDVAAQINAAGIAEAVRDELVRLIGGGK